MSITVECLAAIGTYFSEIFPPAEKKVILAFEKSKFSKFSTSISLPLNFNFDPALLEDATKYKLDTGKFFFSKLQ